MKPNEKTSSTTRNKQHNTAIVQTLFALAAANRSASSLTLASVSPGSVSGSPRHKLQVSQSMGRQVHWYLVFTWGTKRMKTTRLDCEISLWKVWSCQQLMRIQQQTVAELDQWIKRRVTHNKAYGLLRPFAVVVSTGIRNAFAFGLRFERQMIPAAGWPMFVWRRRAVRYQRPILFSMYHSLSLIRSTGGRGGGASVRSIVNASNNDNVTDRARRPLPGAVLKSRSEGNRK